MHKVALAVLGRLPAEQLRRAAVVAEEPDVDAARRVAVAARVEQPVEVMDEFYVMYGYLGLFAIVNIGFWLFAAVAVSRTRTKSRKEWKRYFDSRPTSLKAALSAKAVAGRWARRSLKAA